MVVVATNRVLRGSDEFETSSKHSAGNWVYSLLRARDVQNDSPGQGSSTMNVSITVVAGSIAAIVGAVLICGSLYLLYRRHQQRKNSDEIPHREASSFDVLQPRSQRMLNHFPNANSDSSLSLPLHRPKLPSSSAASFISTTSTSLSLSTTKPPHKSKNPYTNLSISSTATAGTNDDNTAIETVDISKTGLYYKQPTGIELHEIKISDARKSCRATRVRAQAAEKEDADDGDLEDVDLHDDLDDTTGVKTREASFDATTDAGERSRASSSLSTHKPLPHAPRSILEHIRGRSSA